jgi:hypothetical protein
LRENRNILLEVVGGDLSQMAAHRTVQQDSEEAARTLCVLDALARSAQEERESDV